MKVKKYEVSTYCDICGKKILPDNNSVKVEGFSDFSDNIDICAACVDKAVRVQYAPQIQKIKEKQMSESATSTAVTSICVDSVAGDDFRKVRGVIMRDHF